MQSDALVESAGLSAGDLQALLALVAGTDVVELDVRFGSSRVTLRRAPVRVSSSAAPANGAVPAAEDASTLAIASPLVGVFHPAVHAGDEVSSGQVIGAIEALGMPTSVDAPHSGTVEDLLVPDGAPVEYGQPLIVLRRPPAQA
jgi:biotin carboxyl carrier protein